MPQFHPIKKGTWRYSVAQTILSWLFGQNENRDYYISPWQHAAMGTSVHLKYRNKILFARRAGHLESPYLLSTIGGHVDMENYETYRDAGIRETKEEIGLDIKDIFPENPFHTTMSYRQSYYRKEDVAIYEEAFFVPLTKKQVDSITLSDEVTEFVWLSYKEYLKRREKGEIVGSFIAHEKAYALITEKKYK